MEKEGLRDAEDVEELEPDFPVRTDLLLLIILYNWYEFVNTVNLPTKLRNNRKYDAHKTEQIVRRDG